MLDVAKKYQVAFEKLVGEDPHYLNVFLGLLVPQLRKIRTKFKL